MVRFPKVNLDVDSFDVPAHKRQSNDHTALPTSMLGEGEQQKCRHILILMNGRQKFGELEGLACKPDVLEARVRTRKSASVMSNYPWIGDVAFTVSAPP